MVADAELLELLDAVCLPGARDYTTLISDLGCTPGCEQHGAGHQEGTTLAGLDTTGLLPGLTTPPSVLLGAGRAVCNLPVQAELGKADSLPLLRCHLQSIKQAGRISRSGWLARPWQLQAACCDQLLAELCVRCAGLADRLGGLDAELEYAHVLSQGEQQRVAFLRLLLHRPKLAFLDEVRGRFARPVNADT